MKSLQIRRIVWHSVEDRFSSIYIIEYHQSPPASLVIYCISRHSMLIMVTSYASDDITILVITSLEVLPVLLIFFAERAATRTNRRLALPMTFFWYSPFAAPAVYCLKSYQCCARVITYRVMYQCHVYDIKTPWVMCITNAIQFWL